MTSKQSSMVAVPAPDRAHDDLDPLNAELYQMARQDELCQQLYPTTPAPSAPLSRDCSGAGDLYGVWQQLRSGSPLVPIAAIQALQNSLAALHDSGSQLIHLGDCVEMFADCHDEGFRQKLEFIDSVRRYMVQQLGAPVVAIGRIAGQFAKPRSQFYEPYFESTEGVPNRIHSFMGEMINSPLKDPWSRTPLSTRLIWAQQAARVGTATIKKWNDANAPIYCSHEALSLIYDGAQTLAYDDGLGGDEAAKLYNRSCHLPWIGQRTTYEGSRHIEYLSYVGNPVAAKIGPETTTATIDQLIAAGNPLGEKGKLIFITRVGAGHAKACLSPLIERVNARGAEVLWVIDPMHGNTQKNSHGMKYRTLADICTEISEVLAVHRQLGTINSGLHLEASAAPIFECCPSSKESDDVVAGARYQTLCDPRLDYEQTLSVVRHYLSQLRL